MPVRAPQATTTQLLRRAAEVLRGTRQQLAAELATRADTMERYRREQAEQCRDGHRLGCPCMVLAALDGDLP